jgi:hypothetical protein
MNSIRPGSKLERPRFEDGKNEKRSGPKESSEHYTGDHFGEVEEKKGSFEVPTIDDLLRKHGGSLTADQTSELTSVEKGVQRQRITSPSKWDRVKGKIGNFLKTVGLLGALAGGAKYTSEHTEMSKVSASETHDSWNGLPAEKKFVLPVAGNLPSEALVKDIEPRLIQIEKFKERLTNKNGRSESIGFTSKSSLGDQSEKIQDWIAALQEGINKEEGWANPEKQGRFNQLLKDGDIRRILESGNFTMADAFSLIKSTISNSRPGVEPKDILNELIEERQKLAKTNFIDHNTEQVIIFSNTTPEEKGKFKGDELGKMATEALGEKAIQNPNKYIKQIEAGIIKNINEQSPGEKLVRAIEESPDNTLIYISTHAEKTGIMAGVSKDGKPQMLNIDGFATAFLNRILQKSLKGEKNATDSSGSIKIIIDGCYGYNLAGNIAKKMEELYNASYKEQIGVNFENLKLPTIVTMAGDSSPVVLDKTSGSRALTSSPYLKMIRKEGALTGGMLLKLQSESYATGGDMGFFISDHGKLKEISSNQETTKPTSPKPAFTADNDTRNA